jgi:release factor glutamine methyltransferase
MQNLKSILKRTSLELKAAGIDSADLDARVLLEAAIDKKSAYIFAHPEMPITNAEYGKFRQYIRRRKKGEPIAYIFGHKEFYGYDFFVNKNVLIPRPETEFLVENALEFIKSRHKNNQPITEKIHENLEIEKLKPVVRLVEPLKILDMGTGSGNIIISLVKSLQKENIYNGVRSHSNVDKFYACDISKKALTIAKKNAKKHKVNKLIRFYRSDLFSNSHLPKKFDLIIANLPYVPKISQELKAKGRKSETDFEPQNAIFASENGTKIIKKFLGQAKNRTRDGGLILMELDPRNAPKLKEYSAKTYPNSKMVLKKDLAQRNRYLKIQF